nr:nitroreductase family deazaflavin-dependent oxidoreductase [Sporichthya sp.]
MEDINEWNRSVIEEFRANAGVVSGVFTGIALLILHNVGAKSGEPRLNPLAYQQLEDGYAIFGSMGGAPKNPAWVHNIAANPKVEVEFGDRTEVLVARVASGSERARIWAKQKVDMPQFAEYEAKTDREIPVIVLESAA